MKKLIHYLFGFVVAVAASMPCWADITEGQHVRTLISACADKAAMLRVLKVLQEKDAGAAFKLFQEEESCDIAFAEFLVGHVVHSAEVKEDGKTITMYVVEMVIPTPNGEKKVMGYFLTSVPVHATPDRNS